MPSRKKDAATAEIKVEPKPKRRKKAMQAILESREAKAAVEPEPPMPEPSHVAKLGPRRRDVNEPGSIYDGPNVRITMDADIYMIDAKEPFTTDQQDRIVSAGFDDVSEAQDGSLWLAQKWQVAKTGTDINVLAVVLDCKGERLGRTR